MRKNCKNNFLKIKLYFENYAGHAIIQKSHGRFLQNISCYIYIYRPLSFLFSNISEFFLIISLD